MYAANFGDEGVTHRPGFMLPTCSPSHVEIETLADGVRETSRETSRDIGNTGLEGTTNDVKIAEHLSCNWKTKIAGWETVR